MRVILPSLALVLALSGCRTLANPGEVVTSKVQRATPTALPAAQLRKLTAGNRAFAVKLYQQVRRQEGNLFYSPYSISVALGMTYAGARGRTEQQMAQALSFYLPQVELHPAFNALDQTLASRGQGAKGTKGQPFRLHIANALWGQTGQAFLPAFLDLLGRNYGAGMRLVDFKQAEAARGAINGWVSDETEKKITDLIPPGALNAATRLVLTNAIYFNAAWQTPFRKEATRPGPFTLLTGKQITVDMMHGSVSAGYAARGDWEAVDLPYEGRQLAMTILLPKAGRFASFERALAVAQLEAVCTYLRPSEVMLTMPKFKHTSSFSLSKTLVAMGMPEAFQSRADFSGMTGRRDLFISDVIHKALVDVDEEGTEAAAATAVIMMKTGMPTKQIQVTIDRPFLFLIRDLPTGAVLFMGRVVDPKG